MWIVPVNCYIAKPLPTARKPGSDTTEDLLAAFRVGEVDALYNVPLSALQAAPPMPEDVENRRATALRARGAMDRTHS